MNKLKRAVVKEELVALTGDYTDAIILNQFIYWSERVKDFDKFISEEKNRAEAEKMEVKFDLTNGWIYKTAEEMASDTLTFLAKSNMRIRIKKLISKGWIDERVNPKYKWDKTYQYRVNLFKIAKDLDEIGYSLEGYRYNLSNHESENRDIQNETSSIESKLPESNQNYKSRIESAIPEITTEITTDIKKSVSQEEKTDRQTDESTIKSIINQSELYCFPDDKQKLVEESIRVVYTQDNIAYILKMGLTQTQLKDRLKELKINHIDRAFRKYDKRKHTVENTLIYFTKVLIESITVAGAEQQEYEPMESFSDKVMGMQ